MLEYVGIEDFVICIYLPHRSHNFAHVQVAPSVYTVASAATLAKELSCQGRRCARGLADLILETRRVLSHILQH